MVSQQGSSSYNLKDRYLADELKIGFGNIQKPYNRTVDLLIFKDGLIIALTNGKFVAF
jgi:hypothetical protein